MAKGAAKRASAGIALGLLAAALLVLAVPAQAKEVRLPQGQIGSFTEPKGLAVDQETHDLYAIDGRSEEQRIKVSATAGKVKLKFGGKEVEVAFNASAEQVNTALIGLICPGGNCLFVNGGLAATAGGVVVNFQTALASTDVEQIVCESGTPPLSGGTGCSVETVVNGVNGTIARYHADGTPSNFSALGANRINGGTLGPDQTPQGALHFDAAKIVQIAVDDSGTATDGEIYATQWGDHLVDVFAPSGEFKGQLTEYKEGAVFKPLQNVCGVAVDNSGNVFVGDTATGIHKYDPSGAPVTNADSVANFTTVILPCALAAGAGPTAGFLFADRLNAGLFKLDAAGGEVKCEVSGKNTTVSVDPASGNVLAAADTATAAGYEVAEFDAKECPASPLGTIVADSPTQGMALDAGSGDLYLARKGSTQIDVYGPVVTVPDVKSEAASKAGTSTATLNGTISAAGGPEAHCSFQYTTEAAYLADLAIKGHDGFAGTKSAPCEPAGPFTGSTLNQVHADLTGLTIETKYEFRIAGENANTKNPTDDPGETLPFETFGKPAILGGKASQITTTEATITGQVDPHGLAAAFAVQYVTAPKFAESGFSEATATPAKAIGAGIGLQGVSEQLTGLEPETAYRFRLTATNEIGQSKGKEGAFATFAEPGGLLDERAWEMVTPPLKLGEPYAPAPGQRSGLGGSCKSCTPGWDKPRMPMQSSPDGNALAFEGDPFEAGFASGANEYRSRRTEGGWQTAGLSPPQMQDRPPDEGFKAFSADLSKAVLVQQEQSLTAQAPPGFANLYLQEEGKAGLATLIEAAPKERAKNSFVLTYAGANAGTGAVAPFSRVVFQANDALTPAVAGIAPAAPKVGAGETDLYEWSGGQLRLVNVLPENKAAAPNAVIGSEQLLAVTIGGGNESYDFDHAISDDGSRIFWSKKSNGQLYVREGAMKTLEVPDHAGKFITATPSGSKVLLSDGMLYDLQAKSITDLSAGQGGFQGIAGKSEDLSRIYFVDSAALTPPEEENANGEAAEAGKPNLYLWEAGAVRFIATLLPSDNFTGVGKLGAWHAAPGDRTAQATADGRFLAFQSRASLTDYDSTIAEGEGCNGSAKLGTPQCFEVFEYDAASATLACASCNPSGQAPLGPSNLSLIDQIGGSFPQPRNLPPEGEGRLFFESQDTLSLADQNDHIQDVYEWEPNGVGSCTKPKGCLELISNGQSSRDSFFLDASDTGNDAFFITRSQLYPTDEDDFLDVYDARSEGGFPYTPEEPCEGEACKGPAGSPPEVPGAASSTFANQEPPIAKPRCPKGKVRRHGRCVRVRKHHGRAARHHRQGGAR